jgi:hypothetical protein
MVALNRDTYIWGIRFVLEHMFPETECHVEMFRQEVTMSEKVIIRVLTKSGHIQSVSYEVWDNDPFNERRRIGEMMPVKIPREILATIMLLAG